jgi:4-amino-4-deoxy-L-arabinose transferase-like glycosyltransferase
VPAPAAGAPARGTLDRPLALAAVAVFLLVVPAGMMGLLEPHETRIAEAAREMLTGGGWMVPRLNGLVDLRTPPLTAWLTAAGVGALGADAWGARVIAMVASVALLVLTGRAAQRLDAAPPEAPPLAGWLLLGSLATATLGRMLSADLFLAVAVTGWWILAPSPWAFVMLALGALAKGPSVVLFTVLPVLVVAAARRDRAVLARLGPPWGWVAAAALTLPWYATVAQRVPGALAALAGPPAWFGGATGTARPVFGSALGVVLAAALPWTPALLAGCAHTLRGRERAEAGLLLAWVSVPVLVLSLSGERSPLALLPALPAAAMLAAIGLERGGNAVRHATGILLLVMAGAAWIAMGHLFGRLVGIEPPEAFRIPAGVWLGIAALGLAAFRVTAGPPARTALLVAVGCTAAIVGLARFDRAIGSPRAVIAVLGENRGGAEPVVMFGRVFAGLPFHLGATVRTLGVPAPPAADPATLARVAIAPEDLAPMADAHGRVWLVGPRDSLERLVPSQGLRWTRIALWKDVAVGYAVR